MYDYNFYSCNFILVKLRFFQTTGCSSNRHKTLRYICYFITLAVKHSDKDSVVFEFYFTGEVLGFENLVYSVFEFIHGLIETSKFRSAVKKTLDQLLYYVLHYMQITEEQVIINSCSDYAGPFLISRSTHKTKKIMI